MSILLLHLPTLTEGVNVDKSSSFTSVAASAGGITGSKRKPPMVEALVITDYLLADP